MIPIEITNIVSSMFNRYYRYFYLVQSISFIHYFIIISYHTVMYLIFTLQEITPETASKDLDLIVHFSHRIPAHIFVRCGGDRMASRLSVGCSASPLFHAHKFLLDDGGRSELVPQLCHHIPQHWYGGQEVHVALLMFCLGLVFCHQTKI